MKAPDNAKTVTVGILMALAFVTTIGFCVLLVRTLPHAGFDTGRAALAVRGPGRGVETPSMPGVTAVLSAGEIEVLRTLPAMSFRLVPGETLDPRLPPGRFTGEFRVSFGPGRAGRAVIGAEVQGGQLIIRRRGAILLSGFAGERAERLWPTADVPPVPVDPAGETITFEFTATGDGVHALRALWRPDDAIAPLPLPSAGAPLLADPALRGMLAVQERNCVACHRSGDAARQAKLEVHPGPDLAEVGTRVRPAWLRRLLDPRGPGPVTGAASRHPRLHALVRSREEAEDLTHFLVARGGPIAPEVAVDESFVATGEVMYHRVGCFACHGPLAPPGGATERPTVWREYVPLEGLAEKTTRGELAVYLADPLAIHPGGAMPGQALTDLEAETIAACLVADDGSVGTPFTIDPVRVARGRDVFAATGCANCHTLGAETPPTVGRIDAPALEALATSAAASAASAAFGRGCLASPPPPGLPDYSMSAAERRDVLAFLEQLPSRRSEAVPWDDLVVDLRRLRCTACHAFHSATGPEAALLPYFETLGEADLGDEGRLPPRLDGAGARLTDAWLHDVLAASARARPYLGVRMPAYGDRHVEHLPHRFAAAGGLTDVLDEAPAFSAARAAIGRTLTGADGFACIQCHSIAGREGTGTPGPDLALMPGRLRYESFSRWLHDPARVRPGTRMPSFFVLGFSAITDQLGGRAEDQVDAIWAYLSQGESLALPDGLIEPGGFELVVHDEPIVFRTFMQNAGVRAIACGFPEQVHCAFDADQCLITTVWHGRFLSAQGAWGGRGGNETNPDAFVWTAPDGPLLEIIGWGEGSTTRRFRGYDLDEQRRPILRYDLATTDGVVVNVEERPRPVPGQDRSRLVRSIRLSGPPGTRVAVNRERVRVTGLEGDLARLDDSGQAVFDVESDWETEGPAATNDEATKGAR